MNKIPRSITRVLQKVSRENKSNMLNSLKQQYDINDNWKQELQTEITIYNQNKRPKEEYIHLIKAWGDAQDVNFEIKKDIDEVIKSIKKDDNINKGGKRKRRKTKKSKKNKRKTRRNRIKGGLTPEEVVSMQNRIRELENDASDIEMRIGNINNGNREFELERSSQKMYMKDEIRKIVNDEKAELLKRIRPILREQGRLVTSLIINGYGAGV